MPKTSIRYVALLRGINVGGNKKVPMADLKKLLEKAGYTNVKTLLASGNVLFDAPKTDAAKLRAALEKLLAGRFGFAVPVLIRTQQEIAALVKTDPFKGVMVTPDTRLYVTFLPGPHKSTLKIPYSSPDGGLRILRATPGDVCSVVTLSPSANTIDLMATVDKEFGKTVTTRSWNTVVKLLA